jgi:hypothetical protein
MLAGGARWSGQEAGSRLARSKAGFPLRAYDRLALQYLALGLLLDVAGDSPQAQGPRDDAEDEQRSGVAPEFLQASPF